MQCGMSVAAIHARIAEIQSRFPAQPSARTGSTAAAFSAVMDATTATAAPAAPAAPAAAPGLAPWSPSALPAAAAKAAAAPQLTNGVPSDLAAYGNGKIPASALVEIEPGHRLWSPAAAAFKRLRADASAAGITIGVTDSYRSYEQQVDLAQRKGLYSEGGLAAKPGTSDHGWGKSVDLDLNPAAQAWMRENAQRYGFSENVPREPWHWTFGA